MRAKSSVPRLDVVVTAALVALTVANVAARPDAGRLIHVAGILTVAPLAPRQVTPVAVMTVTACAVTVYSALESAELPNAGLGLLIAMFTVGTMCSTPVAALMWLLSVLCFLPTFLNPSSDFKLAKLLESALILFCSWALGESTKRWAQRVQLQAEQARRAVADERVRIARELHAVVAHHMSVISLQAGLARYVFDSDPQTARTAVATIDGTSREALQEMRRLLDVLRLDDDGEVDLSPQPGIEAVPGLVERVRAAGLAVELVVTGRPRPVSPGVAISAYRIAQESLTNVLKHAGAASARVGIAYHGRCVEVRITDDGAGARTGGGPSSYGMRERTDLYGGTFEAGPRPDDQPLVRAGLAGLLEAAPGIDVVAEAANGVDAVASATATRPDVVLMDVRMPELDGISATRRILSRDPGWQPRIIILTTFDISEYVYTSLREGASGFLLKDTPADRVIAAIHAVAAGDVLLSPRITRRLIESFARHHVVAAYESGLIVPSSAD
ncbi:response regulator [Amycolatopsis mediterranei]|uniref:ATP-binding response regulator n=2 Tax=Amycolatopsis mediterranei TaxID=33910 RepID=UPI001E518222|nr:response regulator [Amycolatopsis mediterranei]UZF70555.1 response regulator [Amycolatopsis mediterranei]